MERTETVQKKFLETVHSEGYPRIMGICSKKRRPGNDQMKVQELAKGRINQEISQEKIRKLSEETSEDCPTKVQEISQYIVRKKNRKLSIRSSEHCPAID